MVKVKKQNDQKEEKKFKLSQIPWEIIALIVLLIILGCVFYSLGQSTSSLGDGLFPNW